MTETPIKNILIVIAMEAEAGPFINHLDLKKKDDFFPSQVPFVAHGGTLVNEEDGVTCEITVATPGKDTNVYKTGVDNVGTVPASLLTFLSLQKLHPEIDLVLNAGTCGGFAAKGAKIGNAYLTTAVANHDRRIPIPPFIPYGIGKLESVPCPNLIQYYAKDDEVFYSGICTTGNSLDKTPKDEECMTANDATVKDMEAAAVAWSCQLHSVPYLGLKVVTDIVDGDRPTEEEFLENLGTAAQALQRALPKVCRFVAGKTISEL